MAENQSVREVEPSKPLAEAVREVFDRRAAKGERKLIMETYGKKLEHLIQTMPKEQQENIAIKIQKVLTTIRAFFAEYGARFTDFIRKIFLWPMILNGKDFPKDKYYQIELARAKAWGEFGMDTTKTATTERSAYRDHFFSTSIVGAQVGAGILGSAGLISGAMMEGAKVGAIAGVQGAAVGAVVGGVVGGAISAGLWAKDKIMGPPVVFYDLLSGAGKSGVSLNITQTTNIPNIPQAVPGLVHV